MLKILLINAVTLAAMQEVKDIAKGSCIAS
jgi:hypothetical protein